MKSKSLVSIDQCSKEDILRILDNARKFEANPNRKVLEGKVAATLFFEPSTRTRLSFETAVNRLGGRVIGFSDASTTSSSKGETLKDTILMVSNYADIIVMRHHLEGAARYASEVTTVPIVNAGDGANQHPSQTMLDLYSIYKTQGTLENLNIFLVGDLKYGRTVHSLLMAMRHFNPTFHFIAPDELRMPEEYKIYCREHNIKYVEHTDFTEEIIADADILYMTRVQRERFTDLMEYERVKNVYILRNKMLEHTRPNLRILHPLPRVNEIAYDVDDNPKAYYFQQAQNGLYAREAILCDVLGITLDEVKKSKGVIQDVKRKETGIAGCCSGKRHCNRPYTLRETVYRSLPARTGTHEQQYHHRLQPQEQEAGHERHHQDCRQVLLRRRDKPYRRGGSQCKTEHYPRLRSGGETRSPPARRAARNREMRQPEVHHEQ